MRVYQQYAISVRILLLCVLTLTFCFLFASISFCESITVTPYVNGNSYIEGSASNSGTTTKMNGGTLKYEIDISEYQPWISSMRIGVSCSDCDRNERSKGYDWPNFSVKQKDQDAYGDTYNLSNDSGTEQDFWTSSITSPSSYIDSKDDGGYKVTVKIYAKKGITDHAEVKVYKVKVELHLNYNSNTMAITGGPKEVNFGQIDLGATIPGQNAEIANVGNGTSSLSWKIDSSNTNTPAWINAKGPTSIVAGNKGNIALEINRNNVNKDNVKTLKGKLVPIFTTDSILPTSKGFKCDVYHFPNDNLANLDTAISSTTKKLVYSGIIPTIEFNKGGNLNAYVENEVFKSGSKTINVRRDFLAIFSGFIKIENSGTHTFFVSSDDGFRLKIYKQGQWVTVKEYTSGKGTSELSGTIDLAPDIYPIELTYFQGGGAKSLTLEWIKPGGSREVVPNQVMDNGMNILIRATPKKPTVTSITSANVISNKTHVRTNTTVKFTAQATVGSTNVPVTGYRWKKITASESIGDSSTFDAASTSAEKNFPSNAFPDPGNYKVYCIAIDDKGVESDLKLMEVRAWNPPTVRESPPQSAITAKTVSWYVDSSGIYGYAGIINQAIKLMGDGTKDSANNDTNEVISKFIWDFDGNWTTTSDQREQTVNQALSYTWSSRPLAKPKCKAVNNYNIQSDEREFTLTVYDPPSVEAGGPYTGKPIVEKELKGLITNAVGYSGATFAYQWSVKVNNVFTSIPTSGDGTAKNIWMIEGTYEAKFDVTVTTKEGLILTASDTATVVIEAGKPTAMLSSKIYRGGINGGNFSPIQFEGNQPDYIESDDVGYIRDWMWLFSGTNDVYTIVEENVSDTITKLTSGVGTLTKDTINAYYGEESLKLGGTNANKYNANMPGWEFKIVEKPVAANEFRYITFAWRKDGGTGIMIQLNGSPNAWNHRYHSGANAPNYLSTQISTTSPAQWEVVTRDLFQDWGAFTLNGIAFTPWNGTAGYFDSIYLHKSATPPTSVLQKNWQATNAYSKAGNYTVGLKVKSQYGKWSVLEQADVNVIDGKITGYVKAADLRTPVKNVQVMITSSHVDQNVLTSIASADSRPLSDPYRLSTFVGSDGKLGLQTQTNESGFYSIEHIPLGSYIVRVNKTESKIAGGSIIHEFESNPKTTELTLDAPGQLAIDFTDLSVFPISGRIVYSIKKYGTTDVPVEDVVIESQPVGSTSSSIKSLPSNKSFDATGGNYNVPLFSGQYSFIASRQGHDIRIKPGIANDQGIVTISKEKTDLDFIDYTERNLTVFVVDSGNYKMTGINIEISGENGQATGKSDDQDGKLETKLPPGKYTVTVKEAVPSTQDVDLTGADQSVTMIIPVKIELSITPIPKFFDARPEFLEIFGLRPEDNPEGYMYYYPPEPRTHVYTITATANGHAVEGFNLFVNDEISMMTSDPPEEQEINVIGTDEKYTITAGLPKLNRTANPPLADKKYITFRAEKENYAPSDSKWEWVTILGDVAFGSAQRIVSIPVVNYTVLHDPPGDGSYSYLDDSMTLKGMVSGMTITMDQSNVPVYPSPWSDERKIKGVTFDKNPGSDSTSKDLESKGLIGTDKDVVPTGAAFIMAGLAEAASGALIFLAGPAAFAAQLIKVPIMEAAFEAGASLPGATGIVQYEVSPKRRLETPSGDTLPDILGPGKGDVYFGEGWTLGLQTKYRLGIKLVSGKWTLLTDQIETYDILERTNQYIYTIKDIQNIVQNLTDAIAKATDEDEKTKLQSAQRTWESLLSKNLAYVWNKDYASQGKSVEEFLGANAISGESENMIFSAGPKFEYSRKVSEGMTTKLGYTMTVGTNSQMEWTLENKWGFEFWGTGITMEMDFSGAASIETGAEYGAEWESGKSSEQTVGFVLNDDDVGDNISTRVYADPVWGTPLFFQDPGSVTSDPWEAGTNMAVDVSMSLQSDVSGTVDYHEGANYKIKLQYEGSRVLESSLIGFEIYAPATTNVDDLTVEFNGAPEGNFELSKDEPSATITVSLYPPDSDQHNSEEKQYSIDIGVYESADPQTYHFITLKPRFADLRPPRAIVVSPYDGQRISPSLFKAGSPFKIQVTSADIDLANIQLQIRAKQPNGMWETWRNLTGMKWEDGKTDPAIEVFEKLDRIPAFREFTFSKWTESEIKLLGVGEYAIRAVATDKSTKPNTDLDPPFILFLVDESKPTVLTTTPNYQDRESQRIYQGELSVIFTDDMKAGDFTDRTFYVTDLLKNGEKVGGFVSYSPALRKAIFVPIVPFKPNGFYRVEIKTDTEKNGVPESGVHDLAGNPLDNAFMWTFHTTEAPFEPVWSINFSIEDCASKDGNNIAGVEYGASDGEDEKDARSVPSLASKLRLNFLDQNKVEFDRDIHPADGRLSHRWFFAVVNAANCSSVKIRWKPSSYLLKTERQYQVIRLIEFDDTGKVKSTILLDPTKVVVNSTTGEIQEAIAYEYNNTGETVKYFRLDVMKVNLVATVFKKGSSGWKFFSAPITPQIADPFVNLGDDIDPLQVFQYNTKLDGYKVYPLDLGEVSIMAGYGYFTRLSSDAEVDVGGPANQTDVKITLKDAGWYAIGNPFIKSVKIADLKFSRGTYKNLPFADAVKYDGANLVEPTLYHWVVDSKLDKYEPVTSSSELIPWDGYWIRTKQPDVIITIPVPANIASAENILPDSYKPPMAPSAPSLPIVSSQFDLRLELASDTSSDVSTILGAGDNAKVDRDGLDQSEPPTLGQTVAVYFDHQDWGDESGLYNTDYQPTLKIGEERKWTFTAFNDKPNTDMILSWENTISQVPGDIMLYFRQNDNQSDWQDMRKVKSVRIGSQSLITKVSFEVRAQRFDMSPLTDVNVSAGEKQVTLRWRTDSNDFIDSYIITRQDGESWKAGEGVSYVLKQSSEIPVSQYIDTNVDEDKTYIYQISTRFRTGAELRSELFTVRIKPVIKQTVLMQNYPNPFNPEVWIPYELSEQTSVLVQIYNSSGQLIRTLDMGVQQSGRYTSREKAVYWDGKTEAGEYAVSGVYFYVMKAGNFIKAKKMILLK
jgi:hypothetical protein